MHFFPEIVKRLKAALDSGSKRKYANIIIIVIIYIYIKIYIYNTYIYIYI